jgi:hypothetical protein
MSTNKKYAPADPAIVLSSHLNIFVVSKMRLTIKRFPDKGGRGEGPDFSR